MSIEEQNQRLLTIANAQIANLEALLIVKDAQINNLKDLVELYKKSEQRLEEELTNKK